MSTNGSTDGSTGAGKAETQEAQAEGSGRTTMSSIFFAKSQENY
jgi:hypothetical protein